MKQTTVMAPPQKAPIKSIADGVYSLLLILSALWLIFGAVSWAVYQTFDTPLYVLPISIVVLIRILLVWIESSVLSAVVEGLAIGFALQEVSRRIAEEELKAANEQFQSSVSKDHLN